MKACQRGGLLLPLRIVNYVQRKKLYQSQAMKEKGIQARRWEPIVDIGAEAAVYIMALPRE